MPVEPSTGQLFLHNHDSRYVNVTGDTMTGDLVLYNNTVHTLNYTLTVPATGTTALLGTANVFTTNQKINCNSTTALFVEQDGVNDNTFIVDTTNNRVGIGGAPLSALYVYEPTIADNFSTFRLGGAITSHSFTSLVDAKTYFSGGPASTTLGGGFFGGFSSAAGMGGLYFTGQVGHATPTAPALNFQGWKLSGTTRTAMTGTNKICAFYAGATTLWTMLASGNFGSLAAPTAKFHIVGDADTQQLIVVANATQTANILEIQNSSATVLGGVDERGVLFSHGGIDSNSVFIGDNAGRVAASGAVANIGIGYSVLDALTSGDNNIGIGYNALSGITSGSQNIAIGYEALLTSATNSSNIAIGYYALREVHDGESNTVVGALAMYQNQHSGDCTAIGYRSQQSNTGATINTGSYNTSIGSYSLANNILGLSNIAIGYYAGKYETGSNALYIDNQDRTTTAIDKTNAIIYGVMAAAPANQTLRINAATTIGFTTAAALIIGIGTAGIDYNITFDGETNDGILTWMEDENYFTTPSQFIDGNADQIQLRVQANSTQTTNLQTWEKSDGTVYVSISPTGRVTIDKTMVGHYDSSISSTIRLDNNNYADAVAIRAYGYALYITNTQSTTANPASFLADFTVTNGASITNLSGFKIKNDIVGTGVVTNFRGLHVVPVAKGASATLTNYYGLFIADVNVASTLNYAIYTGLGDVRFGDDVLIASPTATALTIGVGTAGIDYQLKFDGETTDGILTYMEDEGRFDFDQDIDVTGNIDADTYSVAGAAGADGTFTTVDLKTVTVVKGIITSIV